MKSKNLVILGSTGSIGRSTIDVIEMHPGRFCVKALAALSNVDLLLEQYRLLRPDYLCLVDPEGARRLANELSGEPVEVLTGEEELVGLAGLEGVDLVLNAVVGAAGLRVSLATVEQGRFLALANKESLVAGGPLFGPIIKKTGAVILPVDSEHSAIWQCLKAGEEGEIRRIILTASGGPFRKYSVDEMAGITVEQALDHPTWKMGPKITIDSATLANKGLEVIEAVALFSVPADKVRVVIHPQSIVHSAVEFIDSTIIAQLSRPDMRLPISYALFWPERMESEFGALDMAELSGLTFEEPDLKRFPARRLAIDAAGTGGTAPAVFNAANEVAVDLFLNGTISFLEIADMIKKALDTVNIESSPSLDDVLEADRRGRQAVNPMVESS
jgi:1-deoxy-D-xylulose-5-phosphate reductoisomerase